MRHDKNWIIVNTIDNNKLIIEKVLNLKDKNIISELRAGDRFITTPKNLTKSKMRYKFSSIGLTSSAKRTKK